MSKQEETAPRRLVIRHFEDEPGKIDLPELIEIGLYHTSGVTNSEIAISDGRDRYDITFRKDGQDRHLVYVVEPTIAAMDSADRKSVV